MADPGFAERMGLKQPKTMQIADVDRDLRVALWNALTYYLQDLAARLHAYYYKHRILPPALEQELDNQDNLKASAQEADQERKRETLTPALTAARLCLFRNVQSVIRNGLGILGVSAPERM